LHRDLDGELVFPLQVVINLSYPGIDHAGGEFLLLEQRPRPNREARRYSCPTGTATCSPPATAPSHRLAAGRPPRSGTESRPSAQATATRSRSSSTTRPKPVTTEQARDRYTLVGVNGQPYEAATPGTLAGHRAEKIYGRLDCPAALRAIARGGYLTHRVFFADGAVAIKAGYRPCGACLPDRYARWKDE
jgi:Oxygenase, catalysing oxidative methylation of damaged DNA/Metal binding domain of Ada